MRDLWQTTNMNYGARWEGHPVVSFTPCQYF
jgi:hypothetical protein